MNIYLPFIPEAKVDYLYLIRFFQIAQYRDTTKARDFIYYSTIPILSKMVNISPSTLNRIFKKEDYKKFLLIDKENKCILLNSCFKGVKNKPYVILTPAEITLLQEKNDNLFCKYLIYVKYYCRHSKKSPDFTAKQFLLACGYSTKSKNTLDQICKYNAILVSSGLVKITKVKDSQGHTRNFYSYL